MYKLDDGNIVCKVGGKCRNGKEQKVPKTNSPKQGIKRSHVRIGQQIIGRIEVAGNDYRTFIAHPELGFAGIGVYANQQEALDAIGNAIMRKLWEV